LRDWSSSRAAGPLGVAPRKMKQRELDKEGLCAKFFRERPHLDPTSQLENYNWDWRTTKVNADGTQEARENAKL
jgi:hypothetical protein